MKTNKRPSPPEPPLRIGVLGPHKCGAEDRALGVAVGEEIARHGAVLLCGGMGGMMEAAAEGARRRGGLTVGILPGDHASEANAFIQLPLPTGLGPFRNMLLVKACDAVIAVRGGHGTLSEIAFALRLGVPVVGLYTWSVVRDGREDPGIHAAEDPAAAVTRAVELARRRA